MSYSSKKYQQEQDSLKEKLVNIRRVTKVTKGGKQMGFSAFVIVGDQDGNIGLATSKSREVPVAIRKSVEKAKKKLYNINTYDGTIPHRIIGEFKSSKVVIRPAPKGTGVIAGGSIRIMLELLGLENVVAKSIGSNNAVNVAKATLNGLVKLKNMDEVQERRGVNLHIRRLKNKEVESNDDNDNQEN